MLTIAQITDLHITTDKDRLNQRRNEERLRQVLKAIHALRPRPVSIIASGDLVDRGELEEYLELKRLLADCEIPIYFALGNHDLRGPFLEVFNGLGAQTDSNGYVQYTADFGDMPGPGAALPLAEDLAAMLMLVNEGVRVSSRRAPPAAEPPQSIAAIFRLVRSAIANPLVPQVSREITI